MSTEPWSPSPDVTVTVRCVGCKHEREIRPYEIPEGEMPMCDKCFSPMVAVRARRRCKL